MNEDRKNEKIGRTILTLSWWLFAAKFLIIVSVITAIVLYFLGKPLWLAPVIAIGIFLIYRCIWRLIWLFIDWAANLK